MQFGMKVVRTVIIFGFVVICGLYTCELWFINHYYLDLLQYLVCIPVNYGLLIIIFGFAVICGMYTCELCFINHYF